MKAWLNEHKFYLVAAAFIALGAFYYYVIYQPEPASNQQITETNKSTSADKIAEKPTDQQQKATKSETVMVDVKGEIKQPGVYTSNQSERVIDVIQKAGGLTDKADDGQVNFAAHVQDEMVLYIPAKGEIVSGSQLTGTTQPVSSATNGTANNGKININRADQTELENLPGIGPAKAESIIQYREENGPYKVIEDLKKISGIGDKTFEKLKESISVQ